MKCKNCKYWECLDKKKMPKIPELISKGNCQRYAPSPLRIHNVKYFLEHLAFWPVTYGRDWCGDFKKTAMRKPKS